MTMTDFMVPPSISSRRLPIKSRRHTFWLTSVDYGRFLALGDRPGEFLLDADALELVQRLVQTGTQRLARGEGGGKGLHALDDADRLVVLGALRVADVIGHPVEHGGQHRLEHRAGHVRPHAAMHADA